MITERYFNKLSKIYDPLLSKEGTEGLNNLKIYFGRKTLFNVIRNMVSFHYSREFYNEIDKYIDSIKNEEIYELYLSNSFINCLFLSTESIIDLTITQALKEHMQSDDMETTRKKMWQEIEKVIKWVLDYSGSYVKAVLDKYFEEEYNNSKKIQFEKIVNIDDVEVPYFVYINEKITNFN